MKNIVAALFILLGWDLFAQSNKTFTGVYRDDQGHPTLEDSKYTYKLDVSLLTPTQKTKLHNLSKITVRGVLTTVFTPTGEDRIIKIDSIVDTTTPFWKRQRERLDNELVTPSAGIYGADGGGIGRERKD
jgi:hypothetical protein